MTRKMDIIRDRILSYIFLDGIGEEVEKVKRVFCSILCLQNSQKSLKFKHFWTSKLATDNPIENSKLWVHFSPLLFNSFSMEFQRLGVSEKNPLIYYFIVFEIERRKKSTTKWNKIFFFPLTNNDCITTKKK